MVTKDLGPVSAYALAVAHGFKGTEEEFARLQAESGANAQQVAADKAAVADDRKAVADDRKAVEELVPTIKTSVNAWLDEHPEATTTVQDKALTAEKLSDELRTQVSNQDYRPLRPSFGWIDDDGKAAVYTKLYPWAVENAVPFTYASITCWMNENDTRYVTAAQMKEMHASGLVRVASHTRNHRDFLNVPAEDLVAELGGSKQDIEQHGVPCDIIVYPNGNATDETLGVVRKHYRYGMVASGTTDSAGVPQSHRVNYPPVDTYRILRLPIDGAYTEARMAFAKQMVDDACASNGMLIFMSHIGSTNGATGGASADADLLVYTEMVEYIRSKGYDIEPVSDICDRFRNAVEIGKWSSPAPGGYYVVGADGSVSVDRMTGHVVCPVNAYKGATPPSGYPTNQVTTCYVKNDADTPATSGVLTAYMTADNYGYRTFVGGNNVNVYTQVKRSAGDSWSAWSTPADANYLRLVSTNGVHGDTTPEECPDKITICMVSQLDYITALPGGGQPGTLTTYKISATASNTWQEWKPFAGLVTYTRKAATSTTWGPWYKFEPVAVE